jgi:hypothetical protein
LFKLSTVYAKQKKRESTTKREIIQTNRPTERLFPSVPNYSSLKSGSVPSGILVGEIFNVVSKSSMVAFPSANSVFVADNASKGRISVIGLFGICFI